MARKIDHLHIHNPMSRLESAKNEMNHIFYSSSCNTGLTDGLPFVHPERGLGERCRVAGRETNVVEHFQDDGLALLRRQERALVFHAQKVFRVGKRKLL
jgi:hypothetical protein